MSNYEEYTFFAESTQKLTDRRQAATQTYLGVSTAIFASIAFLTKDVGLHGTAMFILTGPLFVVGIFSCVIWHKTILDYKAIIAWRYEQLIAMEKEIPNIHAIYTREAETFFAQKDCKRRIRFSTLERALPLSILILYLVTAFAFIVSGV